MFFSLHETWWLTGKTVQINIPKYTSDWLKANGKLKHSFVHPLEVVSRCWDLQFWGGALSDFSDAFVFRRGGSLRWILKIFNQLIFSLSSGLFFFQSNMAYVVIFCYRDWISVIQIRKLEYVKHLSMYVLRFKSDFIVLTGTTFILLWDYKWAYVLYRIISYISYRIISYIFMLIIYDGVLQTLCILKYFSSYCIFSLYEHIHQFCLSI